MSDLLPRTGRRRAAALVLSLLALAGSLDACGGERDPRQAATPVPARASAPAFHAAAAAPRVVGRPGHALVGRGRGGAAGKTLAYARTHLGQLGLRAADLRTLRLAEVRRRGGAASARFVQQVDGVPFIDGQLRGLVDARGRLLQVDGGARAGVAGVDVRPAIGAARAVALAARATGATAPALTGVTARRATLPRGGVAELVIADARGLRLAWRVVRPQGRAMYDQLIDARTGAELRRVDRADAVTALAYPNAPGAAVGGTQERISLDAWLPAGAPRLESPALHVFPDPNGNDRIDAGEDVGPDANGNWDYARQGFADDKCPPVGCAWRPYQPGGPDANRAQSATQAFVTSSRYLDHLAADPIRFHFGDQMTAATLSGADMLDVHGPDADHLNNAFFQASKPGLGTYMYMYVFGGRVPRMSGADDPAVVEHEITHGLSNRLVVDGDGWGALTLRQPQAIGEALSDFYALDDLERRGLVTDTDAPGEVWMAAHVDPDHVLIRTEAIDCPVGSSCPSTGNHAGGYTFADYGKVDGEPEPHSDGEIMAQTLWDLRRALIAKLGRDAGIERTERIVTDALALATPAEPTFLDLRNAILQADVVDAGSADLDVIWRAFADRGMGVYASAPAPDDVNVVADFSRPGTQTGVVSGTLTDRLTGALLAHARVTLSGHGLAQGTHGSQGGGDGPAAASAETGEDGSFRITAPAGVHPHAVVEADGYERTVTGAVTVRAGETVRHDLSARRNWADTRLGAHVDLVSGTLQAPAGHVTCPLTNGFDGSHASGFTMSPEGSAAPSVIVELPQAVDVSSFAVDPRPGCRYNETAQLRAVTIEVAGTDPDNGGPGPWTSGVKGAFGPDAGHEAHELRPNGPLHDVSFVKVTMLPQAGTDTTPAQMRVGLSELQVFAMPQTPPRAAFEHDPALIRLDQPVTLTADLAPEGAPPLTDYRWDLDGDGSFETRGGETPTTTTTFRTAGDHQVGLRVTNSDGESDEFVRTLHVSAGIPFSDLGTVDGTDADASRALHIDADGVVTGSQWLGHADPADDTPHAFRMVGGEPSLLADGGAFTSQPYASNTAGTTVGALQASHDWHAVAWAKDGTMTDLGGLTSSPSPTGVHDAEALDINEAGDIVGYATDRDGSARPTLKLAGKPVEDLQVKAGIATTDSAYDSGKAMGINDAGDVVGCLRYLGHGGTCLGKPFVYSGGRLSTLPLPTNTTSGGALAVNDDGEIVGTAREKPFLGHLGPIHAVRWHANQAGEVLDDGGAQNSEARDVNSAGHIVGYADDRAVWWRNGVREDLNRYVDGTGWKLQAAYAINDRDEIVGWGTTKDGSTHAFQLDLGGCRVCISGLEIQEHDPLDPGAGWQDTGGDGTVDGNTVRVRVTARNDDDVPHTVAVALTDQPAGGAGKRLDPDEKHPPTLTVPAHGEATSTLEWDTEGFAWKDGKPQPDHVVTAQLKQGRVNQDVQATDLTIRPKPVILVHGMASNAATWKPWYEFVKRADPAWRAYAVGDGKVPGVMDTGVLEDPTHKPNGLKRNSEILSAYIDAVRGLERAEHVDLVAHSMGGLISRRYISAIMPEPATGERPLVSHLIQLGTPNAGSPCANLLTTPTTMELRPDLMEQFNADYRFRKTVPFSIFAGSGIPLPCPGAERGDVVVPLSSALWMIRDRAVGPLVVHMDMTGSSEIFTDFALPRLDGDQPINGDPVSPEQPHPSLRAPAADGPAPDAFEPEDRQLLDDETPLIAAGGEVRVPLAVDGGGALSVQVVAAPQVGAQLLDPAGKQQGDAPAGRAATAFRTLRAEDAQPGPWTLVLHNTGAADVRAEAAATIADDPWHVDLVVGRRGADGALPFAVAVARDGVRRHGGVVHVRAQGVEADGGDVSAFDDGRHDDGAADDGCFGGAVAAPADGPAVVVATVDVAGTHRVRVGAADVQNGPAHPACPLLSSGKARLLMEVPGPDPYGPGQLVARDEDGRTQEVPDRVSAAFSPDGRQMAYTAGNEVWVADADGGRARRLIGGEDDDVTIRTAPAWSPDGSHLAYSQGCEVTYEPCSIWQIPVAGGEPQRVTPAGVSGTDPAYAPGGGRIAFTQIGDYHQRCNWCWPPTAVATIRLDGTGLRPLTRLGGPYDASGPVWSPSGDRVAYTWSQPYIQPMLHAATATRSIPGRLVGSDIVTAAPDGGDAYDVTRHAPLCDGCGPTGMDATPLWSRDGQDLLWNHTQDEQQSVWRARRNGSGAAEWIPAADAGSLVGWWAEPPAGGSKPPACQDAQVAVRSGESARVALTCVDPDGDPITYEILDGPAHGTLSTLDAAGAATYTPAAAFVGDDRVTFRAHDATGVSATATLTLHVAARPPAPTCGDTAAETTTGRTVRVTVPCASPGHEDLRYHIAGAPAHGEVHAVGNPGQFDYTPAAGFTGTDRFGVTATDRNGTSKAGTVTVTVKAPVVTPPPPPPPPDPNPPGGGKVPRLPGDCPIGPSGQCVVPVGCPQAGHVGDAGNCTGLMGMPLRSRRAAASAVAKPKLDRRLVVPKRFTIKPGRTAKVAVRLTAAGRKQLKRKHVLRLQLVLDLRRGGKVITHQTRTVRFKLRKRPVRH